MFFDNISAKIKVFIRQKVGQSMQNEKDLLIRFYSILPDDYIKDSIGSLKFTNRDIRRKYAKCKNLVDKLMFIDKYEALRLQLLSCLYSHYKSSIPFSGNGSFETVLSSYNKENCISNTVFILYRCSQNNDSQFGDKQLLLLLESEQFNNTINNTWNSVPQVRTTAVADGNSALSNYSDELNSQNIKEEVSMNTYLGYIQNRGSHYNFMPQYIMSNDGIEQIDAIKLFPNYGGIYLECTGWHDDAYRFLETLKLKYTLFAIELDDSEIEKQDNLDYEKKVVLSNFSDLNKKIVKVDEKKIYKIIEHYEGISKLNLLENRIDISDYVYAEENDKVLLKFDDKLYGPFSCSVRQIDGRRQITPTVVNNSYLCSYYKWDDEAIKSFTWSEGGYNGETTDIKAFVAFNQTLLYDDMISDGILIGGIKDNITLNMMKSDSKEFDRLFKNSPYFSPKVPDDIKWSRKERIKGIFSGISDFETNKNEIVQAVINLIQSNDEYKKSFEPVIIQSKAYVELRNEKAKLITANEALEKDKKELSDQCEKLKQDNENCEGAGSNRQDEGIDEYEEKIKDLKKKITDYESKYKAYTDLDSIKEKISQQRNFRDSIIEEISEYEKKKKNLQFEVKKALNEAKNGAEIAFNPYISNTLLEAAAEWKKNDENKIYSKIVENLHKKINETRNTDRMTKEDLIEYLVGYVKSKRQYSYNDIINMYICLTQGFLTIFAGEPGTGKTSICNILADSLGLSQLDSEFDTKYPEKYNRYIPVAVERGWSSKRDLIGYFNPLTKEYSSSNGKIYDALKILDLEKEKSELPYIILLDEANLSPMEYYWSDFMRAADDFGSTDNVKVKRTINIGTENEIYIPKTLKFFATINNDQTVTPLSPRLIDRAWIIKLPKGKEIVPNDLKSKLILWDDLCSAFAKSERKMELAEVANNIYDYFEEYNINVSKRIRLDIEKYVCTAQDIMRAENDSEKHQAALDYAIVQKLLPKIDGEYSKYEKLFDKLESDCSKEHLTNTLAAIKKMRDMKDNNMGYCQFM